MKKWLRRVRDNFITRIGNELRRQLPKRNLGSFDLIEMGWFNAAMESARYYGDHMQAAECFSDDESLREFSVRRRNIQGLVLEFGVASGRTINQIARAVFPEPVFGFDSFNGLPEDWNADHRRGKFAQAVPSVQPNVELIVGLFAKTLPQFLKERSDQQVSLLHIDCDLYSSTKVIFEELSSRIVPGTVIIFDEYFNYPGWQQHEFKAFQEFVFSRSLKYSYIGFNRSHAQVTVVIDG
jgi:hypothetical protein